MRRDPQDDVRVADTLFEAFRTGGYATSMRTLSDATGLKSASLYHRFSEGKPQMAVAAVRRAGALFVEAVIDSLEGDGAPEERLAKAAAGLRRFYADGTLGCILGVLALTAPSQIRREVEAAFTAFIEALARTYAEARVPHPAERAQDAVAAIHGALVLGQAGLGTSAFARALERLAKP